MQQQNKLSLKLFSSYGNCLQNKPQLKHTTPHHVMMQPNTLDILTAYDQ